MTACNYCGRDLYDQPTCTSDDCPGNCEDKALRLAEHLEKFRSFPDDQAAAAELRRLHSVNTELLAVLRDVVASSDANCGDSLANAVNSARAAIAKAEGN